MIRKIFTSLLKIKALRKPLLKLSVNLHNAAYKMISIAAVSNNNGVHPKYTILAYDKFFVKNVLPTDMVIDIGCGNGFITNKVAAVAKEVVGIDLREENIKEAKEACGAVNIRYEVADGTSYKIDKKFDKIISSNVLEHIDDRIAFLESFHRLSDTVLLRVPMVTRDWVSTYKMQQGLEYRLVKDHRIEYSIESLTEELEKSGWRIKKYSIQFGEFWGVLIPK